MRFPGSCWTSALIQILILGNYRQGCNALENPAVQPAARPASINARKEFYCMEVAIVIVAVIAYMGFRQWLRYQRRVMIHRERLAAVVKGLDLPPLEPEVQPNASNGH